MIFLENPNITDPHINLAVEEFLLRHIVNDEPLLLFYVNAPSVIVGRNQNVFEEVNFDYVLKQDIPVLRRLSGGGTVYHDPGNLNYSLISPDQILLNNYTAFTRPVINALREVGLTAELRNRSSIFVDGKKISGNAQYATAGRLVSHGTLLLDSDLDQLRYATMPRHQQVESRAVQSIRSRVVNLRDLLAKDASLDTIKGHIRREFTSTESVVACRLGEDDWKVVQEIAEERYRSWSWNIGRSPKFSTTRRAQTDYGWVVLEIHIEKGHIQAIKPIENNPQIDAELLRICDCLQGVRYDPIEIAMALHYCKVDTMPPGLSEEQLANLIY